MKSTGHKNAASFFGMTSTKLKIDTATYDLFVKDLVDFNLQPFFEKLCIMW